jgi:hypothetical protein
LVKKPVNKKITPAGLKKAFDEYLQKCRNHTEEVADRAGKVQTVKQPKIPTIKDFWCVHLGLSWGVWGQMLADESTAPTCQTIRDTLEGIVLDALINGEGNSTGLIFDLKANYGYTDKQLAGEGLQVRKIEISVRRND